ncbi:hypothetical protein BSKO_11695 [Bryopsis sp. KO-2023]|nr:hypothetical protein BSKO_11695 [Bryopsis sp. KO-2023]
MSWKVHLPNSLPSGFSNPRIGDLDRRSLSAWKLPPPHKRDFSERPSEVVNSIPEKRATDPILKYQKNTRKVRDLFGKDTSHKKIERKVKGERSSRYNRFDEEDYDHRSYTLGPEEGAQPQPRKIKKKPKFHRNQDTYRNPLGKDKSSDPSPPPIISPPYIPMEDVILKEGDPEWEDFPDITADEVLRMYLGEEGVAAGVRLNDLETWVKCQTIDIERSGSSSVFSGILPKDASLKVTITNDYHECEKWAADVLEKMPKHMGFEMFNGYISEAIPQPTEKVKQKYRDENKPPPPPPLPVSGPLKLREEGSVIFSLCLCTDEDALIIQLHQMYVIGPTLRKLLESPFVKKGGQHVAQNKPVLREDGVDVWKIDDVKQVFIGKLPTHTVREKVGEVIQRAGYFTWVRSITGVPITEPIDLYPYMWGEEELTDEMIDFAVRKAFGSCVLLTIMSTVDTSDFAGLREKEAAEKEIAQKDDGNAHDQQLDEETHDQASTAAASDVNSVPSSTPDSTSHLVPMQSNEAYRGLTNERLYDDFGRPLAGVGD